MITHQNTITDNHSMQSSARKTQCETVSVSHARRRLVSGLLAMPLSMAMPAAVMAKAASSNTVSSKMGAVLGQKRELSFYHTHTGKNLAIEYYNGHTYSDSALDEINRFLCDFRTEEIHPIDKNLLDALFVLQQKSGIENDFEIISAYRSPKTNALLRKKSSGVAKRSLHMQGKAIDIRLKGYNTRRLRELAMAMKVGGVGYYRRSDFIHMDTGRVRYW